jgi:formylglycine-generating enzyme required for sulfatase activity
MAMLFVPSGEFRMGSEIGFIDEQPVHTVFLDAYWIDRTEVTNAMYNLCAQSGACNQPASTKYSADPNFADHPVAFVSWSDATAYCAWAHRRLPTEAEWEKAATWDPVAKESRVYPWGDDLDCSRANFDDELQQDSFVIPGGPHCDGYDISSPVASYPSGVSPYGVHDMAGNVWEWVADGFFETQNYYAISPVSNPKGPERSAYRVLRGGSWNLNYGYGRSAYRLWFGIYDSYDGMGFRCALSE